MRFRYRFTSVLLVSLGAGSAAGEPQAAAIPVEQALEALPPLHAPQRLTLDWPIMPNSFSFGASELGTANGPLLAYRAEALWWETENLKLSTVSSSLPGLELDCRLSCAPVLERSLSLDLRRTLGSAGAVREPYLWTRSALVAGATPLARGAYRLMAGIGGLLDL